MSTSSASPAGVATATLAKKFLYLGIGGLLITAAGFFLAQSPSVVATSYLVGVCYWTTVVIGMLLLTILHHLTDAGWSVVIRRQYEHGMSAFKWLFILFIPLLISAWLRPGLVWPWMDLSHSIGEGHTVGTDMLYQKKSGLLNRSTFTVLTVLFFGIWIWLAARFRKASFTQDTDGAPKWTFMNRKTAGFGVILTALSLTAAAILWMKSLEYHWFSTMYGVWFFANCMRAGMAFAVMITYWLYVRGDFKGIHNTNQFHCLTSLAFAFVIFWAYVSFAQYFLIWNANVPEETFWYNIREHGDWLWIGMVLLFGHFFIPFVAWIRYRNKVELKPALIISIGIAVTILIDICYNTLPALKDTHGDPLPFFSLNLFWVLTSVVGVGGICVWAYLNSFTKTKIIPIRDPRILESLTHHEATAP